MLWEQLVLLEPLPTSTQFLPHPHLLKTFPKVATVLILILFVLLLFDILLPCPGLTAFLTPLSTALNPLSYFLFLFHSVVFDSAKVQLFTQSAAHFGNYTCPPLFKSFVSLGILVFFLPSFMSASPLYFKSPSTLC